MNDEKIIGNIRVTLSSLDFEHFKKAMTDALKARIPPDEIMLEGIAGGLRLLVKNTKRVNIFSQS